MSSREGLSFVKPHVLLGVWIFMCLYMMPLLAVQLPPTEPAMQEDEETDMK